MLIELIYCIKRKAVTNYIPQICLQLCPAVELKSYPHFISHHNGKAHIKVRYFDGVALLTAGSLNLHIMNY